MAAGSSRNPERKREQSDLRVRFWGVRGSTPTPCLGNLRYGGNTPCLELRWAQAEPLILDCGTGFRELGKALEKEFGQKRIRARIFLTHYHWDHIQGIPFFTPLYSEQNQFVFHGFPFRGESVEAALEGQMVNPYFPVNMSTMRAQRRFLGINEERMVFDDLAISSRWLHHPQGCLGYRIEYDGKVLVYATDNEPGDRQGDESVRRLAEGADVFIYDAQFLPEQMEEKRTWGHSHWKEGVGIAKECGVKKLVLFHHDPDRDDESVDKILQCARDHFDDVVAAKEGLALTL